MYISTLITLGFLWPLVSTAPPQEDASATSEFAQGSGSPDAWKDYLLVEQDREVAKWIGSDPTHITYDVVTTTAYGKTVATTAPVDVSIQPASATAADGTHPEDILLAPHILAELTDAAQQACGGSLRKRQINAACVRTNIGLKKAAVNILKMGLAPEKVEAFSVGAASLIAATALGLLADTGSIPNAVKVDLGVPAQVPTISTGSIPNAKDGLGTRSQILTVSTPVSLPPTGINSLFSSSSSIPTGSMSTVVPGKYKSSPATSSASTSTVLPDACWRYTGTDPNSIGVLDMDDDQEINTDAEDSPNSESRLRRDVHKRGNDDIKQLGSCSLGTTIRWAPPYWKKDKIMEHLPAQQWWFVPSQASRTNQAECPVAEIIQKGKRDPYNPDNGTDNFPLPYNTKQGAVALNVDHVYELKNLKTFFNQTFKPGDDRCDNFTKLFLQPDGRLTDREKFSPDGQLIAGMPPRLTTPASFMDSRLQSLWNEMPNKFNKAFIGMGKSVNAVKACLFQEECRDFQNVKGGANDQNVIDNLNYWNDLGMAMQVMRVPVVQVQMHKVHEQMYKGLVSFEEIQACNPSYGLTTAWAEAYNNWFNEFLKVSQQKAAEHVSKLSVAVAKPEVTEVRGRKNAYGRAVDALEAKYGSTVIASGSLTLEIEKLLSIPARTPLGIARRDGAAVCSTTVTSDPPVTGLPSLPSGSVCSSRLDKGNGVCPQLIVPNPSSTPCPPITSIGQYCADLTISTPPTPAATICPDPTPNLAKNRCDEKCMGAGWGNCQANVKDKYNRYSCYCNDGPCGGKECGDPVKIDEVTGKGTKCPEQKDPSLWFPNDQACDIACPNGNYGAGDSCFTKTTQTHTMKTTPVMGSPTKTVVVAVSTASDKNGLIHWEAGTIPLCECDDDPCKGYACYDRHHEL